MIEVEVKIAIRDRKIAEERLLQNGFSYQTKVTEDDIYYTSKHYDMQEHDKALRIRTTENLDTGKRKAQLNCKGPKLDQISMTRKEIELEISEPDKMKEILIELEFYPAAARVKKTRTYYRKNEMTATVDQVENLGDFLELEILAEKESDREKSLGKIRAVLEKLGCKNEKTLQTSYLSMLEGVAI